MSLSSIGRYQIVRPLGEGGMGTIWLARDPSLDRDVVIKGLRAEIARSDEARERLLREAKVLGRLDHPHIVQVYDLIEQDGHWYICMQHVRGRTVREILAERPLAHAEILRIASGAATALAIAHEAGVIHRDIKPENVMVTAEGEARLLDFGIAWRRTDPSLTSTDISVGTLLAMAPEQFAGHSADRRSDLFSLGVLLYEMTTGAHPFAGKTAPEVSFNIMNREPTPPLDLRDDAPIELLRILSKCLEKAPDLRYQHADEVLADLRRLRRELETGAVDPILGTGRSATRRPARLQVGEPRAVPAQVPMPGGSGSIALASLALVVVAAFVAHPPRTHRYLTALEVTPGAIENTARSLLAKRGVRLFGYSFVSRVMQDPQIWRFEAFIRMAPAERRQLEHWRPPMNYQVVGLSADRAERYQLSFSPDGRLLSLLHGLRPDHVPDVIPADSAATLARDVAVSGLRLDLAQFVALPVGEAVSEGRVQREYRWRLAEPLPGGATASASVKLTGAEVVEAATQVDLPPTVTRTFEQKANPGAIVVSIVMGLVGLASVVQAIRRRWFIVPSAKLVVLVASAVLVSAVLMEGFFRSRFQENGIAAALPDILVGVFLVSPIVGALICVVLGLVFGILRAQAPELIPGLDRALQGKISRSTWARSAAIGCSIGATAMLFIVGLPWAVERLGLGRWWPHEDAVMVVEPIRMFGELLGNTLFDLMLVPAGIAMAVLLKRWTRIGNAVWPLGVALWATGWSGGDEVNLEPAYLTYVAQAAFYGLVVWTAVRFGLLAGLIAVTTYLVLSDAIPLTAARLLVQRMSGAVIVLAWFGVFALSWLEWIREGRAGRARSATPT